ncbi:318_t:CDS:2 [Cetraspora pellucida]|uniref:318_t:CDS:1 n=1 Tax=Cetraspora pellucida TaxID=1433469 RepID=A0ACA9K1E4_9GLOM|nr:318_t:CDS:2 [Cetraspora pellucida]
MDVNILLENLSEKLGKMLKNADDFNTIIRVGQDPNVQTFYAHSNILRALSPYFNKALSKDWVKKEGEMFVFEKPNVSPSCFETILKYIYTGTFNLDEKDTQEIIDIIIASDEFMLSEFIPSIESYLIEKRSDWLRTNIELIILTCSQHSTLTKLRDFCFEELCDEPQRIFNSPNFCLLNECFMISLIQRNDLNMNEIEIWESLIRWGKAQIVSNLKLDDPRDVTKYSQDDFTTLRKTIEKILPYIRFDHICPLDFKEKVVPYKSLISSDAYEEILWKYIIDSKFKFSPSFQRRIGSINSKIIKKKHATLIASWVDQKDSAYTNDTMPYEFVLEIRGTYDGFSYEAFKYKGDNIINTIIVARVKNSKEVIGGYNPCIWRHDRWKSSEDFWRPDSRSFIFSFPDGETTNNAILSRIDPYYTKYAMYIRKNNGPEFGNQDFYMSDRFDLKTGVRCRKTYYLKKIRDSEDSFAVDEYELFRLVRK